jgi:hypothetical protein
MNYDYEVKSKNLHTMLDKALDALNLGTPQKFKQNVYDQSDNINTSK